MPANEPVPFELRLSVSFPREIIFIKPPVPTSPQSFPLPSAQTELGTVLFYFDWWDIPRDNDREEDASGYDHFFVHFIPADPPHAVKALFGSTDNELRDSLFMNWDDQELVELQKQFSIVPPQETEEQQDRRKQARILFEKRKSELIHKSREACDRLFAEPELASYFGKLSQFFVGTVQKFLEVLRIKYRQYLIPDHPSINWSLGYWILPGGEMQEVSEPFLDRLFPHTREITTSNDIFQSIEVSDWPVIMSHVTVGGKAKSELSEVLMATAFGECDPQLGNPRLGLIEAVIALEIEVKALMYKNLSNYGISKKAIERIVRDTALADLASIWIRREMPQNNDEQLENKIYEKCAQAIHERNELVHLERRTISLQRAKNHIKIITKLVEKVRQVRTSAKS